MFHNLFYHLVVHYAKKVEKYCSNVREFLEIACCLLIIERIILIPKVFLATPTVTHRRLVSLLLIAKSNILARFTLKKQVASFHQDFITRVK